MFAKAALRRSTPHPTAAAETLGRPSPSPTAARPSPRRREALGALSTLGALTLMACGGGGSSSEGSAAGTANAALSGLSLSSGSLSPAFASGTLAYSATVGNATTSIRFTPTTVESGTVVRINGVAVASGQSSTAFELAVGGNAFGIVATATDGSTATYAVVVNRAAAALSADNTLSALAVSPGVLSPAFSAATLNYAVELANSAASIAFAPATSHGGATIRINGVAAASGSTSGALALNVGSRVVTIEVTAEDGVSVRSYTVTVTRAAAGAAADATLASLQLSGASLVPAFASGVLGYTAAVSNAVASVALSAAASQAGASILLNGAPLASGASSGALALAVGSNTVTLQVTAADGSTTATYTLAVTRAAVSNVATLSGLALSSGSLSPAFAAETLNYSASVANSAASLSLTPTATSSTATVRVNGVAVAAGAASNALALAVGSNTLSVVVTAQDGATTRTYTVVVTRAAASLSADASLSALALSAGTLSPAFAAGTASYTASVANTVTTLALTPAAAGSGASIRINGASVASGSTTGALSLSVGSNTFTVQVTAQDGATIRTYTVVVTRAAAAAGSCVLIPRETEGPFPLLSILSNTAVVRSDIREDRTGLPLTLKLALQSLSNGCAPLAGAAVYIWHCDKDGLYSGYSQQNNAGQAGRTFLRGVQVSDANGEVVFTTIYPGWYAGRITHIHFQIYLQNNLGTTATATSQLGFPAATTTAVYNTSLYAGKGQNSSVTSFAQDNVFSDGTAYQIATVSGDTASGLVATLNVGIA